MASMPLPHLVLDNTYGVLYVSVVVSAALWGINAVQTWTYFMRYPKDLWFIKPLVIAVTIFNTGHQVLITHSLYWYLVSNYLNPLALGVMVWSIILEVFFTSIVWNLVIGFLVYRVHLLSHKQWILTSFLIVCSIAGFVLNFIYGIRAFQLKTFVEVVKLRHMAVCITILYASLDIIIAALLCYLLHKSRTGMKQTDSKINRIMVFTINTGLLTSIVATGSWITFLVFPRNFIYIAIYFPLGRLYVNSLLASLNSRPIASQVTNTTFSLRDVPSTYPSPMMKSSNARDISIKIDTVREISDDLKTSSFGEV